MTDYLDNIKIIKEIGKRNAWNLKNYCIKYYFLINFKNN